MIGLCFLIQMNMFPIGEIRKVVTKFISSAISWCQENMSKTELLLTAPNYQIIDTFFNKKRLTDLLEVFMKIEPKKVEIPKLKSCEYVPLESPEASKRWSRYLEIERKKEGTESFKNGFFGFLYI